MRAYEYWIRKIDPSKAARILIADARKDGESRFIINCIQSACDNHLREKELANLVSKNKKPTIKSRAQIETEEALKEEFIW